ncbi:OmpA family protein [Altericroceibacterium endophyticum]|uniref:OmpA family protein n=1 Tax=Altericroceibacterium endophyticum TaxID=1808508 RepID=A0A6I4T3B6_9SPHN|nr:OmpA family protein [Altericroceibacterium endophyticum]MXO65744.1 OmpA family protein [Altericroceibacterium endophyticum]
MKFIGATAALISAAALLSACERVETPEAEPSATPTAEASTPAPTSIIRPDVAPEPVLDIPPEPLKATASFANGGFELSPDATKTLQTVLESDQAAEGWPIILRGHSDSEGTDSANLKASKKRAEVVAKYLIANGVDEDRITVIAFGEQNPVVPNARPDGTPNEAGRALNRRVDISIAPPEPEIGKDAEEAADNNEETPKDEPDA